jgi:regulator of vacuolar morphogenesis
MAATGLGMELDRLILHALPCMLCRSCCEVEPRPVDLQPSRLRPRLHAVTRAGDVGSPSEPASRPPLSTPPSYTQLHQLTPMSIQSIAVPSSSTRTPANGGKAYTAYHITLSTPVRAWAVDRRYSDFESLAREIEAEVGRPVLGERLPGKKVWGLRRSVNDHAVRRLPFVRFGIPRERGGRPRSLAPRADMRPFLVRLQLIEERRIALEAYLRHILSHKDPAYRSSHAFLDFLAAPPLQPTAASSAPSTTAGAGGAQQHMPSTTAQHPTLPPAPTSFAGSPAWLAEYQTLQSLARTIRASLGRRDELLKSGQTTGGHTAGVVARKDIGILLARLGVLAGALKALGEREKLGSGEMGRRGEMISGLQDDCVRLTKQAAVTPRAAASAADRAAFGGGWDEPSDSTREALFGGPMKTKAAQGGETEQTRALDEGGLMHLQQTKIDEQDGMLRELSVRLPRLSLQRNRRRSLIAPLARVPSDDPPAAEDARRGHQYRDQRAERAARPPRPRRRSDGRQARPDQAPDGTCPASGTQVEDEETS